MKCLFPTDPPCDNEVVTIVATLDGANVTVCNRHCALYELVKWELPIAVQELCTFALLLSTDIGGMRMVTPESVALKLARVAELRATLDKFRRRETSYNIGTTTIVTTSLSHGGLKGVR